MARYEDAEPILEAAARWREECLLGDGSILSDRSLWTAENFGHLERFYVENLDAGEGSFFEKLEAQLEPAPPEAKMLAAEVLWVLYLMVTSVVSPDTKRSQIRRVWEWSGESLPDDHWALGDVLAAGVANPGTAYNTHRWRELRFFVTAMADWKALEQEEREALLDDPWELADWLGEREYAPHRQLRHVLLFLLFPETFERIATGTHKRQIVRRFRRRWDEDPDDVAYDDRVAVDREVLRVRERLEEVYGDREIDFYRPPVEEMWRSETTENIGPLDEDALQELKETFLRRLPGFESFRSRRGLYWNEERAYKEELRQNFEASVLPLVEEEERDEGWASSLTDAVDDLLSQTLDHTGNQQNLVSWRYYLFLDDLGDRIRNRFAEAFVDLLRGQGAAGERVERFNEVLVPILEKHDAYDSTHAVTRSFPTLFLMLDDPDEQIFVRTSLFNRIGRRLLGEKLFENRMLGSEGYERARNLARAIRSELEAWGWEPGDMIDVQSFMWTAGAKKSGKDTHSHWIFQCNPDYFDVDGYARSRDRISLLVNQHADDIEPGDRVYLWESGENAGVLGRARVIDGPKERPADEAAAQFDRGEPDQFHEERARARLHVEEMLEERLTRDELREHPALEELSILRAPQGTNFRVSEQEAEVIDGLIAGGHTSESENGSLGEESGFDSLLDHLEDEGFHFPPEAVANYLLALQSKRFVILTGISGTGKTRLAMETARHVRPVVETERVVESPDDALEIEVYPYMLKYGQMVVPVAMSSRIRLFDDGDDRSTQVDVEYPEGETELTLSREPDRNVTYLNFRGDFRSWFSEAFEEGETCLLELRVGEENDDSQAFRIRRPVTRTEETLLDNYEVVDVHPDWTDNRGLLGYYNPITEQYRETPFLDLLIRAREEEKKARAEGRDPHPFFVVLDEMNLARVEHYFSDFLSCLESEEPIHLHDDPALASGSVEEGRPIPRELEIPDNVFFTGTVNVDETTYMFSPKVLDRAFTIELNRVDLRGYAEGDGFAPVPESLQIDALPDPLSFERRPSADDWREFSELRDGALAEVVIGMNELLERENAHFGYRVANEIARFVLLAAEQAEDDERALWPALDVALMEKVLPKFHGTEQEMGEILRDLFAFSVNGLGDSTGRSRSELLEQEWTVSRGRLDGVIPEEGELIEPTLPRTAGKLWRMIQRLRRQGFTSFIQ